MPSLLCVGYERGQESEMTLDCGAQVTRGRDLPSTKMSKDVAKASLGEQLGLRLEFGVSGKHLSRGVK